MFFNSTSNRIKGTLVFFLIVTAVASFIYTHYLVEKIFSLGTRHGIQQQTALCGYTQ